MAWKETSATAWGSKVQIKLGTPATGNAMSTSLAGIGVIKEDSIAVETADGTNLEWKGVGGKLIDQLKGEPTITIKCIVKNLNKSNLSKFWNVQEDATSGKLKVLGMTNSTKYSVLLGSDVVDSETFEAPYCSVGMKPVYSEKEGWGQEVEFTLLSPGEGKPLFEIGQVK